MYKHTSFNLNPDWYQLGLIEYMVLVNPDENVYEKVILEKEKFWDRHGTAIAIKTSPHITLVNLIAKKELESLLCDCIQRVCHLQYSFTVELKNFGGFRPHAIYIHVLKSVSFKRLLSNLKALDTILQQNGCPASQLADRLHMTIARLLDEVIYNQALPEYIERTFYELFTLDKLTLLKRDSRYAKWHKVANFYLPKERTLFN